MRRILVRPEQLDATAVQVQQVAEQLKGLESRLRRAVYSLDWISGARSMVEERVAAAGGRAVSLAERAQAMAQYLRAKAREFESADRAGSDSLQTLDGAFRHLLRSSLLSTKHAWWQARLRGDEAAMAAAHQQAERLRELGAVVTDAENAAINAQYELRWGLIQEKQQWWKAWLRDDQEGMDRAHQQAEALRRRGATEPGAVENQAILHGALVGAKVAWWQARHQGDGARMEALHQKANYLRSQGAVVTDEENAAINRQHATPPPGARPPAAPVSQPAQPVDAMLARYFPQPEQQAVIRHVMAEEGPGKFGAAWGAVVYSKDGRLLCDRQWLNFGLISFALPTGSAGSVFRSLFRQPEELAAFREIALRHLSDSPGGSVPDGWKHLLDKPGQAGIAPLTKEQLVDRFVGILTTNQEGAQSDWFFKYLNTPGKRSGIATGNLRPEWQAVFSEFLSRPASQAVQMEQVRDRYYADAVTAATEFKLTTVRGVGFLFDTIVQHGSPTDGMKKLMDSKEYGAAPEQVKLQLLRDTFAAGTPRARRDAVLQSEYLSDAPYPFPAKEARS